MPVHLAPPRSVTSQRQPRRWQPAARSAALVVLLWLLMPVSGGTEPPAAAPRPTPADFLSPGGHRPGEVVVRYRGAHPFSEAVPDGPLREPRHTSPALRAFDARHPLRAAIPLREAGEGAEAVRAQGSARSRLWLLQFDPGLDAVRLADELRRLPEIERAEPNWVGSLLGVRGGGSGAASGVAGGRRAHVPNDPLYVRQAADLAILGVEQAWTSDQAGVTAAITVAVIDSGVDPFHEDLTGALDLAASYNVADGSTAIFDDLGHGTRVAGLIGATADNGEGIAGVAFGCRLVSFDVADPAGAITSAHVIDAIHRASAAGADVINLSLRFAARSELMREACEAAVAGGALLVAGAGNEARGDAAAYPASFDAVAGVGALAEDGVSRAPSSNFNGVERSLVEIGAPGETLFTTVPGSQYDGEFGSGTSYAAALVSGAGALVMARNPGQSGAAVRAHLRATASDAIGDVLAPGAGAAAPRRLDLAAAVATAMAPVLSVEMVRVDDGTSVFAGNDADGALDAGESAHLIVRLGVSGGDAFGVAASLTTANPAVTGLDGTALPAGAVRVGEAAEIVFGPVTVASDAPQQVASFVLDLTAAGGVIAQQVIERAIEDEITLSGVIVGSPSPFVFAAGRAYHVTGPGSALFLEGEIAVEPGAVIRVDPGVDIVLGAGCTFLAEGTAEAPVLFTRAGGGAAPPPPTASRYGPRTEPVELGAYQQVRYVSAATGSDTTGDGTQEAPWATVAHALSQVTGTSPANRFAVLVAEGQYIGPGGVLSSYCHLYGSFDPTTWERTTGRPTTLLLGTGGPALQTSGPQGDVLIDGFEFPVPHDAIDTVLDLDGDDIQVSNCVIAGSGGIYRVVPTAGYVRLEVSDCRFVRNEVRGLGGDQSGVRIDAAYPGGDRIEVVECLFVDCNVGLMIVLLQDDVSIPAVTIARNAFLGMCFNDIGGGGLGVLLESNTLLPGSHDLSDNVFSGARATASAGVGYAWVLQDRGDVRMNGNRVVGNGVARFGGNGYGSGEASLDLRNSIVARNGGLVSEYSGVSDYLLTSNTFFHTGAPSGGPLAGPGRLLNSIHWSPPHPIGIDLPDVVSLLANAPEALVQEDPQLEGLTAGGWARVVASDPAAGVSLLDISLGGTPPARWPQLDEILLLGHPSSPVGMMVAGWRGEQILVWGNPMDRLPEPMDVFPWFLESYRLRRPSPARGAGVGPALDPDVPLTDFDGNPRSGTTCDIGALQFREGGDGSWGRLWITPEASFASLRHVVVERGDGLLIDNVAVAVSDVVVRQNRLHGLRASVRPDFDGGTFARISALGNYGPGIDAEPVDLVDALAEDNFGFGIRGANVQGARATRNSGVGITASFLVDATAEANNGDGIVLLDQGFATLGGTRLIARENGGRGILSHRSDVEDSRAERNGGDGLTIAKEGTLRTSFALQNGGHGIVDDFAFVEDCVSEGNAGTGVLGIGGRPLARSRVLDNGGPAVEDVALVTDSVIGGNGAGVLDGQTISGSLIFANAGVGVRGGFVTASVVLGNAGDGIVNADVIDNSWVVDNGGRGLVGSSTGSGDATSTTVWRNAVVGVRNLLSVGSSNIFGNDAAATFPVQASISLTGSGALDYTNNWWGEANTIELEDPENEENSNQDFLIDALDGSGGRRLDIWPYATTRLAVPDALPPAFVLDALIFGEGSQAPLAPSEQLGVGLATFDLLFSEAMDTTVAPSVTFGLGTTDAIPHREKVVEAVPSVLSGAAPGWIDPTTWRGLFAVESDTGNGVNRMRVAGAIAADGFALPDDVRLEFVIAGDSGLIANVGGADGSGEGGVRLFWDSRRLLAETGRGTLQRGFNVLRRRIAGGAEGPEVAFRKINATLVPLTPVEPPAVYQEFFDPATEPGASYQYRIFYVDEEGNARQWTPTLSVTQAGPFVRSSGVLSR